MGMLSLITLLPLIGALLIAFLPTKDEKFARPAALFISAVTLLIALFGVLPKFKGGTYHFQLIENVPWIPSLGFSYKLGVDGISIWLVLLSALISLIAVASSTQVTTRLKTFMAMILVLESALIGSFVSLDLLLFFTFFELTLFPMYFLITIWGGAKSSLAGSKFFIYTFAGSIFMLIGILVLASRVPGGVSFDIVRIQHEVAGGTLWAGAIQLQTLVFWSFAIAFLVKAPAFPLHTWMPDTYAESPLVAPLLSSVMVKMGSYGLLRFCLPLFPDAIKTAAPVLMLLAVLGILFGGVLAVVQPDLRRLVAYSSLSHMGFILLGIFSLTHSGLMGGAMQQLNHGISTGAILLLLAFLYSRIPTAQFSELGGLKRAMPVFSALFLLAMLSSVGLPGTNGFIGEFLAMLGAFEAGAAGQFNLNIGFAVAAGAGVVLSAAYLLYMFQQIFYGKETKLAGLTDLKPAEYGLVGVLLVFVFWGGLAPNTFLKPMEASIQATRLMVVNETGSKPEWNDLAQEIDIAEGAKDPGALVKVRPRTEAEVGNPIDVLATISESKLHPKLIKAAPAETATALAEAH